MTATKNAHDWHCEDHGTYGWKGEACRQCPTATSVTDIVERLRRYKRDRSGYAEYCHQAADEIERLKAEKEHYIKVWSDVCDENQGLLNEIERLKAERDPYRELKAASEDPTKQIRCKSVGHWAETNSSWAHPPEEYEIRDKPKATKKVKLLAWLTSLGLAWMLEDCKVHASWIRVPSEDKEVEV